eukprot:4353426-Alexandrium_andersonii.AAC.1
MSQSVDLCQRHVSASGKCESRVREFADPKDNMRPFNSATNICHSRGRGCCANKPCWLLLSAWLLPL